MARCPPVWGNVRNTKDKPFAVFKRGQKITVKWVKNNHRGGFVNFGIVPVEAMWNPEAHDNLTVLTTCFDTDSSAYTCRGKECGVDNNNVGMKIDFVIPTIYPDGKYVFTYSWYGGLYWKRDRGQYADYHHCSHIDIKGGEGPRGSVKPMFLPGKGGSSNGSKCQTSSVKVDHCAIRGCKHVPSFYAKPTEFDSSNGPKKFDKGDIKYWAKVGGEDYSKKPKDNAQPSASPFYGRRVGEKETKPDAEEEDNSNDKEYNWVCNKLVCCSKKCGVCQTSGCSKRNKKYKGAQCCPKKIKKAFKKSICGKNAKKGPCKCSSKCPK